MYHLSPFEKKTSFIPCNHVTNMYNNSILPLSHYWINFLHNKSTEGINHCPTLVYSSYQCHQQNLPSPFYTFSPSFAWNAKRNFSKALWQFFKSWQWSKFDWAILCHLVFNPLKRERIKAIEWPVGWPIHVELCCWDKD